MREVRNSDRSPAARCTRASSRPERAACTVSGWTPSCVTMVPTFQCSPKYSRRISACCSGVIIRGLSRGAAPPPGLGHDPPTHAATDTTARRGAGDGRGDRRRRARLRDRECGADEGSRGSVIPHAAADAIRPLMIAMVQSSFRRALMPRLGGAHAASTPRALTGRRAVRLTAITGGANGKQGTAGAAHLLAQRDVVQGVTSAAVTSPWTYARFRGTNRNDGRGRPMESPRRSRGSGG